MYGNFQTFLQLYSAQAPINSVYKHIHFFISRGLGASAHRLGAVRMCAARLNYYFKNCHFKKVYKE